MGVFECLGRCDGHTRGHSTRRMGHSGLHKVQIGSQRPAVRTSVMNCQAELQWGGNNLQGGHEGILTLLEVLPNTEGVSSDLLMDGLHLSGWVLIPHRCFHIHHFTLSSKCCGNMQTILGPHFYWRSCGTSGSWHDLCETSWLSGRVGTRTLCTVLSTGQRI